jgi:hypothetical protein
MQEEFQTILGFDAPFSKIIEIMAKFQSDAKKLPAEMRN